MEQHNNFDQLSPEWFAARLGKITGSRFGDLMRTTGGRDAIPARPAKETVRDDDGNVVQRASKATPEKPAIPGKPTAARANLIATLAIELTTGKPVEVFENYAMRRGTELEPLSIEAYENLEMINVERIGFIDSAVYSYVGVSPDGLVGDNGMIETKSPLSEAKHLNALLSDSHVDEYKWQIQGQLWVAEREWVDMVSFDPRWPERHQLHVKRVYRDEDTINQLEAACVAANAEVLEIIERLNAL